MTNPTTIDDDLPVQLEAMSRSFCPGGRFETALLQAAVVLRARDTELAAARAVTAKLLDGYYRLPGADGNWWREPVDGRGSPIHEPVTDAERAWLASVSPPADREEPE